MTPEKIRDYLSMGRALLGKIRPGQRDYAAVSDNLGRRGQCIGIQTGGLTIGGRAAVGKSLLTGLEGHQ